MEPRIVPSSFNTAGELIVCGIFLALSEIFPWALNPADHTADTVNRVNEEEE